MLNSASLLVESRCDSVNASRNGLFVMQSFLIMGIFAMRPFFVIRPSMLAKVKTGFISRFWGIILGLSKLGGRGGGELGG